jgi:FkbM family methyltransferase
MKSGTNNDDSSRAQKALADFVNRNLKAPPWENRRVVIYGAGGFGKDLAKALVKSKINVLGFLDQKGSGQSICHDLRAHSLLSDVIGKWLREDPLVVIGVFNSAVPLREIAVTLANLGFSDVITPMEAYPYLSDDLGWRFWMGRPQDYARINDVVERASGLWADFESQQIFWRTLIFRLGFDLEVLRPPESVVHQYADPQLPRWREPLRLVDGGAYNGDTVQTLSEHGCKFAAIYAFEPDSENFNSLKANAASMRETQISLWPCGVGASTCKLRFSEGESTSSKLSESGSSIIPVVALDDVLHGQPVNLIKLDIEGAELDALQGAHGLIEKYRPGLAVCLYHYPDHLWTIPSWVADLKLDYRLYCRTYAHNTFETVLYAIPN